MNFIKMIQQSLLIRHFLCIIIESYWYLKTTEKMFTQGQWFISQNLNTKHVATTACDI